MKRAVVIIAIFIVLILFLSPNIPAEEPPQQKNNAFIKYKTEHYEIITEVGLEVAKKVGNHMETILPEYSRTLPFPEQELSPGLFRVRIFFRKEDFQKYCREALGYTYDPKSFVYYHCRNLEEREVVCFLLPEIPFFRRLHHEAFHQYFRHFIYYPPQWLNEGLAELLEASPITEQGRLQIKPSPGWVRRLKEDVLISEKHRYIDLKSLLTMSKEEWLENSGSTYPESSAFCYYLLKSGKGQLARYLNNCIEVLNPDASREENTNEVYQQVFAKINLARLEKDWVEFIQKMHPAKGYGFFEKGQEWLRKREYKETLSEFNKAIEMDDSYSRYYYFRARTHSSLKRYDQAIKDLKKALNIFPEYTAALFLLAKLYHREKDYLRAKESTLKLIEYESIYKDKAQKLLDEINKKLREKGSHIRYLGHRWRPRSRDRPHRLPRTSTTSARLKSLIPGQAEFADLFQEWLHQLGFSCESALSLRYRVPQCSDSR
jgi:tetratricopeptide (TPR) repeat protein